VHLLQFEDENKLIWQNDVAPISAPHLYSLRRLYGVHCVDDANMSKFNRRLFCCLKRYDAIGGPTYQCSVTSMVFCTLETAFGSVKECFASPFNHNSTVYWSAFPDTDCFFGSHGDFFGALDSKLVQEGGVFYANPPFVEEYMERLRERVQTMLELEVPVTFAVMLPTWTDTECYAWMQRSAFTQMHLVLPAGEHEYIDGRQQIDTKRWRKRHISPFCSTFFILQNELGRARDTVDDETRRRVLASFALRSNV
jgi:phosphorylated CTD-interacting factor 1